MNLAPGMKDTALSQERLIAHGCLIDLNLRRQQKSTTFPKKAGMMVNGSPFHFGEVKPFNAAMQQTRDRMNPSPRQGGGGHTPKDAPSPPPPPSCPGVSSGGDEHRALFLEGSAAGGPQDRRWVALYTLETLAAKNSSV